MQRNSRKPQTPPTSNPETVHHLAAISLTDREQQVLTWIAQGKSSWEIGQIILCEECTVNFHCRNIMGKLNVNTRAHAVTEALCLGLISLQPSRGF
jgi:DNA-binding CsgD family transcriptional regulator